MKYFVSDSHFYHESVISFCNRPYEDTDSMNRGMAHIWNQHINQNDTVYHLGDYSFKAFSKKNEIRAFTAGLNGSKILILGNHDYKEVAVAYGFDLVTDKAYLRLGDIDFKLAHYPHQSAMTDHDKENRKECFTNLEYNKATKKPYPLICGHVHDEWAVKDGCLNVGWDIWHKPLSEYDILRIYDETNGFMDERKVKW